ncbi:MAG: hypothetical protein EBQ95_03290 [Gammaproteobacteria bacterium]|nr:hypothetical protein [Gammaproteobacteria bacterium]
MISAKIKADLNKLLFIATENQGANIFGQTMLKWIEAYYHDSDCIDNVVHICYFWQMNMDVYAAYKDRLSLFIGSNLHHILKHLKLLRFEKLSDKVNIIKCLLQQEDLENLNLVLSYLAHHQSLNLRTMTVAQIKKLLSHQQLYGLYTTLHYLSFNGVLEGIDANIKFENILEANEYSDLLALIRLSSRLSVAKHSRYVEQITRPGKASAIMANYRLLSELGLMDDEIFKRLIRHDYGPLCSADKTLFSLYYVKNIFDMLQQTSFDCYPGAKQMVIMVLKHPNIIIFHRVIRVIFKELLTESPMLKNKLDGVFNIQTEDDFLFFFILKSMNVKGYEIPTYFKKFQKHKQKKKLLASLALCSRAGILTPKYGPIVLSFLIRHQCINELQRCLIFMQKHHLLQNEKGPLNIRRLFRHQLFHNNSVYVQNHGSIQYIEKCLLLMDRMCLIQPKNAQKLFDFVLKHANVNYLSMALENLEHTDILKGESACKHLYMLGGPFSLDKLYAVIMLNPTELQIDNGLIFQHQYLNIHPCDLLKGEQGVSNFYRINGRADLEKVLDLMSIMMHCNLFASPKANHYFRFLFEHDDIEELGLLVKCMWKMGLLGADAKHVKTYRKNFLRVLRHQFSPKSEAPYLNGSLKYIHQLLNIWRYNQGDSNHGLQLYFERITRYFDVYHLHQGLSILQDYGFLPQHRFISTMSSLLVKKPKWTVSTMIYLIQEQMLTQASFIEMLSASNIEKLHQCLMHLFPTGLLSGAHKEQMWILLLQHHEELFDIVERMNVTEVFDATDESYLLFSFLCQSLNPVFTQGIFTILSQISLNPDQWEALIRYSEVLFFQPTASIEDMWNVYEWVDEHVYEWVDFQEEHLEVMLQICEVSEDIQVAKETILAYVQEHFLDENNLVDDDEFNPEQSTHTSSIHRSASDSAERLMRRYGHELKGQNIDELLFDLMDDLQNIFFHEAGFRLTLRCIIRLMLPEEHHRDPKSRVSIKELLVLCYLAVVDAKHRMGTFEDGSKQIMLALMEAQQPISLKGIIAKKDSPICAGGTFNKLIERMQGVHPDCKLIYMTKYVAGEKFKCVVNEEVHAYIQNFTRPKCLMTFLSVIQWILYIKNEGVETVWPMIVVKVAKRLMEEFYNIFDSFEEFSAFLDQGIYVDLENIHQHQAALIESPGHSRYCYSQLFFSGNQYDAKRWLIEHRHDTPELQHAYDLQFGMQKISN